MGMQALIGCSQSNRVMKVRSLHRPAVGSVQDAEKDERKWKMEKWAGTG